MKAERGAGALGDALLAWYDRQRRDLPWRENQDPYRVWVSEIMLQQTRVDVVIPYFQRFLERFPTVEVLAAAPLDDLLAQWSGLGYYRRARQMHQAAREVTARGGFPTTAARLRDLPGIGDYTAAAVASIAFGEAVPVLDGNVERVISRLLASEANPKKAAVRRELLQVADALLDRERAGDSNQAMMELGATVCLPRRPHCLLCPLRSDCAAGRSGEPERYPKPKARKTPVKVRKLAAVAIRDGRVLMVRRPEDSELLAGTWEIPELQLDGVEAGLHSMELDRRSGELAERFGGGWVLDRSLGSVRHSITHRAITVEVWSARFEEREDEVREGAIERAWLTPEEIAGLATSSLVGKILGRVVLSPVDAGA